MTDHAFSPVSLEDFDELSADQAEGIRRALGLSTGDFADSLGWSKRKYQRFLESAVEDGEVPRDAALAIYGLEKFLSPLREVAGDVPDLAPMDTVPEKFSDVAGREDTWTVQIAPVLMQALVQRAKAGQMTTYGAEAERLELAGHKRVWPRTVYAHPLGLICEVCIDIKAVKGRSVPLLTAIVVAQSGEPGAGFDGMVQRYLRQHQGKDYKEAWRYYKANRLTEIQRIQREVFDFPHWDEVLAVAGLL